jgi:hypothetical protein
MCLTHDCVEGVHPDGYLALFPEAPEAEKNAAYQEYTRLKSMPKDWQPAGCYQTHCKGNPGDSEFIRYKDGTGRYNCGSKYYV